MTPRGTLAPWCRIVRETPTPPVGTGPDAYIREAGDVVRLLEARAAVEEVEVFYAVLLNTQSRVLAVTEVSRGILNGSLVHPREVFRLAIAYGAAGIIVAHNHPSGDTTPSADDRAITRQLVEAGKVLGIPVHDHVILSAGRWLSFQEAGLL